MNDHGLGAGSLSQVALLTLGLDEGASEAAIRRAFRRTARERHPDRHPGDAAREERFSSW